ncbi:MAG: sigma-70 family RNA polymerase sigma factor [Verrucomicrobia bacterium]|nr:sigma-70 family RNA polymerase sigma factor [Verrucomicrobiota bacterium]
MMTTRIMAGVETTDAELVGESLLGNREAFGRIVARYQSLICAQAYSATGCLGQSEDLAQETFITAWRHLRQLREPAKLRAWLCGITRNQINNALRRADREPLCAAEPLDAVAELRAVDALPADHAINQEEEAILWRSLERIPETYRGALVLFYREHQSIERVAERLELSEEAVKQRLSRGRKLLHEAVLAFVEGALERTNPGKAFTLGVVAALPALALPAKGVTLGTATVMAQGSSAAKGAAILGVIGFAATSLGAVTGGLFAVRGRIQNARSERERKFLARASWGLVAWKVLLLVVLLLVFSSTGGVILNQAEDAVGWSLGWLGLYGIWVAYSIWMTQRQRRIQIEDGTFEEGAARQHGTTDPTRKGFRAIVYGGLAAMIFGPGGLLLMVVGVSGDRWMFGLLSIMAIAAWLAGAGAVMRRPDRLKRIFVMAWWGLALVTLATFNLRFHAWASNPGVLWPDDPHAFHLPPLWLNIPILAFYGSIGLGWSLQRRFARRAADLPRP